MYIVSAKNLYGAVRHEGEAIVPFFNVYDDTDEPYEWLTETSIAPWVIYVLKSGSRTARTKTGQI